MEHLLYNGRFLPFLMFLLHFIRAIYHSPALLAYQDGPLAASLSLSSRATTTSVARGSRQKIVRQLKKMVMTMSMTFPKKQQLKAVSPSTASWQGHFPYSSLK